MNRLSRRFCKKSSRTMKSATTRNDTPKKDATSEESHRKRAAFAVAEHQFDMPAFCAARAQTKVPAGFAAQIPRRRALFHKPISAAREVFYRHFSIFAGAKILRNCHIAAAAFIELSQLKYRVLQAQAAVAAIRFDQRNIIIDERFCPPVLDINGSPAVVFSYSTTVKKVSGSSGSR